MTWFLVDDGVDDSPELLSIEARYRMAAFGLWTSIGVWMSKQHELFCPMPVIKKLGGTATLAKKLDESGLLLWETRGTSGGLAYTGRRCRVKSPEAAQAEATANAERVRRHRAKKQNGVNLQEQVDVMPLQKITPDVTEHYPATRGGMAREGCYEVNAEPSRPTLRKPGTALESVDDSTWELATAERGLSAPVKVGASRLVSTMVPDTFSNSDRAMLRVKASEMLHAGETEADVAECIREWLLDDKLGPGGLHLCMARVKKRQRNGSALVGADKKAADWQSLKRGNE